ncbi:MAG: SRPBCC domain-containing protein [Ignavibacteriaceae bacterium]|nr:SRPBCC domain-containing protein [Ignavibacteriaceae bacterium]HRN28000.1 SRPBCC domain-containing protein [Ignavibacteriaceae bacterium]HRP92568.1 SRPBCC domain-containing protein [Ignavibacteriaceae bacterium]HRQ55684.1 SRPBCC domain-containing protein [Ignavibacteriaceae bacterium]
MKTTDEPIIIEQIFNSSVEAVWNSITEIEQMHKWYFENIPAFKPEIGFETQFNVQIEQRNFLHIWKVVEVQPMKLIKYSWEFEEYNGKSNTAFEILKENNQTRLRLTVEVLKDFPDDIPEFKRESSSAGWEYFINGRLKDYLENNLSF